VRDRKSAAYWARDLQERIAAYNAAPDDYPAYLARLAAAQRQDPPPWPADDPPPYIPMMDPTFTWSTDDVERMHKRRAWDARQAARPGA